MLQRLDTLQEMMGKNVQAQPVEEQQPRGEEVPGKVYTVCVLEVPRNPYIKQIPCDSEARNLNLIIYSS